VNAVNQRQELSVVAICGVIAIIALIALLFLVNCTVKDDGTKKFDPCKAMKIAQQTHVVASGASAVVCSLLPTKAERAKCEAERAKVKAGADAVLSLGAAIMKACGID
jgi:hypothetical protein